MKTRSITAALAVLFAILLFSELPGSWLMEPDEARYAEIPREMLARNDFVTPVLNGSHMFEKPPLLYWANAASMSVLGLTPFAARLATRLATLATALMLVVELERSAPGWGWWSAMLFLSCPLVFALGRFNLTDGVLTASLTLAFLSMRRFLLTREDGARATGSLVMLGVGVAASMLAKGLVAIVLPGATLVLWALLMGRGQRVREAVFSPAPIVFLILALPWFLLVEWANPGFSQIFFIREHFLRFATRRAARFGPWYYFIAATLVGFLPWSVLLGRASAPLIPPKLRQLRLHPDALFLALWFLVILVFFSTSKSKLIPYIFPAFPPLAALTALAVMRPGARFRTPLLWHAGLATLVAAVGLPWAWKIGELARYGAEWVAIAGASVLVIAAWTGVVLANRSGVRALWAPALGYAAAYVCLILLLPRVSSDVTSHDIAQIARQQGGNVVAYDCYPQLLPWELQRPIPVAGYRGELGSDGVYPPELYWSRDQFWQAWGSSPRMMAVVARRALPWFQEHAHGAARVLSSNRHWALLANWGDTGR